MTLKLTVVCVLRTTTDRCQRKNSSRVPKKTRLLFKPCRYMMVLFKIVSQTVFTVQFATSNYKSTYLNSPYFVAQIGINYIISESTNNNNKNFKSLLCCIWNMSWVKGKQWNQHTNSRVVLYSLFVSAAVWLLRQTSCTLLRWGFWVPSKCDRVFSSVDFIFFFIVLKLQKITYRLSIFDI